MTNPYTTFDNSSDNGRGVAQDYGKAVKWYRRAAEHGQTGAQFNLGVMYRNGLGVGQDPAEAALWFQRAAEAGLAEAQYTMGRMRHLGVVLVRDDRRALAWYRRAAAQGHPKAKNHVIALEAAGVTPLPPSPELALAPDPGPPGGQGGCPPGNHMRGTPPRPPGRPRRAPSASSLDRWTPPPRPRPSGGGSGAAIGTCLSRCGFGFSGRTWAPGACSTGCRPARWPAPGGPGICARR